MARHVSPAERLTIAAMRDDERRSGRRYTTVKVGGAHRLAATDVHADQGEFTRFDVRTHRHYAAVDEKFVRTTAAAAAVRKANRGD
jgi:hypothetical protein